jgi:hypothetical protein
MPAKKQTTPRASTATTDKKSDATIRLNANFSKALDRVVTDASFRRRLEKEPVAALSDIGVDISSKTKAALIGKRLSEILPGQLVPGGEVAHVGVLVVVGVAIGTNLRVDELKDRELFRKQVQDRVKAIAGKKGIK